jgi:hypothetical protein
MNKKPLILSLIRDNLINIKLVTGLNALGLDASHYSLFLGETIFALMGLDQKEYSDKVYEKIFLPLAAQVNGIDFSEPEKMESLNMLSFRIYEELMEIKKTI